MKKFNLSLVALLAMSTFATAGGDVAPVEPVVETPMIEESTSSFYAGLGYSYMTMDPDNSSEVNGDAILLLAGYNFNRYIAVEGRYSGLTDCLENTAIYLKPMYPFGGISLYGLLGYGQIDYDGGQSLSESGFQWGIGASYEVAENIGVFVDYTNFYDDTGFDGHFPNQDILADAINIGFTYKF